VRPGRARAALAGVALALALAGHCADPRHAAAQPPVPDEPRGFACPDAPLTLRGGDADDHADICAGGSAAVAFLERHGLPAPKRIDVEIVARMPPGYAPDAAGCFDPARRLVLLVDHAAFTRFGRWTGRPIDRAVHRAIAAHEVAHAVSTCHFAMPRPGLVAGEYVAYVTMFATMDPALRAHALAVHPDPPWADAEPPDETEYAAEPMRFGARAWRHWLARPDPEETLPAVLEGRLLGARRCTSRSRRLPPTRRAVRTPRSSPHPATRAPRRSPDPVPRCPPCT